MLRLSFLLCSFLLCVSCASTNTLQGKLVQYNYTSPNAELTCRIPGMEFDVTSSVTDQFGPHGGTIKIRDSIEYHRIDIEAFNPTVVEQIKDEAFRNLLYQQFYQTTILPKLNTAYKQALVQRLGKPMIINDKAVYYGLTQIPSDKSFRSTILYTDGSKMFTFSSFDIKRNLGWSEEEENRNALIFAQGLFKNCKIAPLI